MHGRDARRPTAGSVAGSACSTRSGSATCPSPTPVEGISGVILTPAAGRVSLRCTTGHGGPGKGAHPGEMTGRAPSRSEVRVVLPAVGDRGHDRVGSPE